MHANLYFVADGACMGNYLEDAISRADQHSCMFVNENSKPLYAVAPHLILVRDRDAYIDWISSAGRNRNWGVFVESDLDFDHVYHHLRTIITPVVEGGKKVLFRFYDPRVMDKFFDIIEPDQTKEFFKWVHKFLYFRGEELATARMIDGQLVLENSWPK